MKPQQFLAKRNIAQKGYNLADNMFLMYYGDSIEITENHLGILLRTRIYRNQVGTWEYYFKTDNMFLMPFSSLELGIVKKEIEKWNNYECRNNLKFWKRKNKKVKNYSQVSLF